MNNKIICPNCGCHIVDNPEKHTNRDKLCPECGYPYKKAGFVWSPNLNWIKEKLAHINIKKTWHEQQVRGRVKHNMTIEFKRKYDREPSTFEIDIQVARELKMEEVEKEQRKRMRSLR